MRMWPRSGWKKGEQGCCAPLFVQKHLVGAEKWYKKGDVPPFWAEKWRWGLVTPHYAQRFFFNCKLSMCMWPRKWRWKKGRAPPKPPSREAISLFGPFFLFCRSGLCRSRLRLLQLFEKRKQNKEKMKKSLKLAMNSPIFPLLATLFFQKVSKRRPDWAPSTPFLRLWALVGGLRTEKRACDGLDREKRRASFRSGPGSCSIFKNKIRPPTFRNGILMKFWPSGARIPPPFATNWRIWGGRLQLAPIFVGFNTPPPRFRRWNRGCTGLRGTTPPIFYDHFKLWSHFWKKFEDKKRWRRKWCAPIFSRWIFLLNKFVFFDVFLQNVRVLHVDEIEKWRGN